jgi:CRP-like cAMP-binding protein
MISPELLVRYPFFAGLDDAQLKALAMIANEETAEDGATLFEEGQRANYLYFLVDGCIVLYYMGSGTSLERYPEGIPVGEINPGEPFSISALIAPHRLTATARASRPSQIIRFDGEALLALLQKDQHLAYLLTRQAAAAMIERLQATRVLLAAAWA